MATEQQELQDQIQQFLLVRFPGARTEMLTISDSLLENGIIDSLGVLDLVLFIEKTFQIKVEDDDMMPDNFQSIEIITCFISSKLNHMNTTDRL